MKSILCLHLLVLVALAISGCVPASLPLASTQAETQLPSPTTISPTLTPIPTLTAAATLTPLPSLQPEQTRERIRTLLLEPVDCSDPCFWGIVPGKMAIDEANNIFTHLGLQVASTTYEGNDFYGIVYNLDTGLSIDVILTVQDGNSIVQNLRVKILPEKQKAGIPRAWSAYSPETLIARYGEPSQVDFALDWGPRSFFDMVLRFDAVDLIVEYTGYDIIPRQKDSPKVCPLTAQFDSVRLWMGKDPYQPPHEAIPLERATSMTIEEFSKLMMGDPARACFNLKDEAFP